MSAKEISNKPSQRLIEIVKVNNGAGVSIEEAANLPLNAQTENDLLSCINSEDPYENGWGLWFSLALLQKGRLEAETRKALIKQFPVMIKSKDSQVRSQAGNLLVALRNEIPEYRSWMLENLRDSSFVVRNLALLNCKTFLKPKEIKPLIPFKDDDAIVETGGMGGPLVYVLRNTALEQIETMIGKPFRVRKLSTQINGEEVSWFDWSYFTQWYKARNWWRFWQYAALTL